MTRHFGYDKYQNELMLTIDDMTFLSAPIKLFCTAETLNDGLHVYLSTDKIGFIHPDEFPNIKPIEFKSPVCLACDEEWQELMEDEWGFPVLDSNFCTKCLPDIAKYEGLSNFLTVRRIVELNSH